MHNPDFTNFLSWQNLRGIKKLYENMQDFLLPCNATQSDIPVPYATYTQILTWFVTCHLHGTTQIPWKQTNFVGRVIRNGKESMSLLLDNHHPCKSICHLQFKWSKDDKSLTTWYFSDVLIWVNPGSLFRQLLFFSWPDKLSPLQTCKYNSINRRIDNLHLPLYSRTTRCILVTQ